jgi:hypothetical protein
MMLLIVLRENKISDKIQTNRTEAIKALNTSRFVFAHDKEFIVVPNLIVKISSEAQELP